MKLMITGGSGDLGRALCQQASIWGYDVVATYLTHRGHISHISANQAIKLDLCDSMTVQTEIERLQPDVIIHTAIPAMSSPDIYKTIVGMAQNLILYRCAKTRLINLSTDMVFNGLNAPYKDDDPPTPVTEYAQGKAKVESMLSRFNNTLTVRTSLIYDFDRQNKQVRWMVDKLDQQEKIKLFTDEYRNPIWASNLAEALLELAESDLSGILNVAGPERMSRLELGQGLLRAMGYDPDKNVEATSQAGTGRQPDLSLNVSKAQSLLKTRLLSFEQASQSWTNNA